MHRSPQRPRKRRPRRRRAATYSGLPSALRMRCASLSVTVVTIRRVASRSFALRVAASGVSGQSDSFGRVQPVRAEDVVKGRQPDPVAVAGIVKLRPKHAVDGVVFDDAILFDDAQSFDDLVRPRKLATIGSNQQNIGTAGLGMGAQRSFEGRVSIRGLKDAAAAHRHLLENVRRDTDGAHRIFGRKAGAEPLHDQTIHTPRAYARCLEVVAEHHQADGLDFVAMADRRRDADRLAALCRGAVGQE